MKYDYKNAFCNFIHSHLEIAKIEYQISLYIPFILNHLYSFHTLQELLKCTHASLSKTCLVYALSKQMAPCLLF